MFRIYSVLSAVLILHTPKQSCEICQTHHLLWQSLHWSIVCSKLAGLNIFYGLDLGFYWPRVCWRCSPVLCPGCCPSLMGETRLRPLTTSFNLWRRCRFPVTDSAWWHRTYFGHITIYQLLCLQLPPDVAPPRLCSLSWPKLDVDTILQYVALFISHKTYTCLNRECGRLSLGFQLTHLKWLTNLFTYIKHCVSNNAHLYTYLITARCIALKNT